MQTQFFNPTPTRQAATTPRNCTNLSRYREAKEILKTPNLRASLYQLAAHVIDPKTWPNPYGQRAAS